MVEIVTFQFRIKEKFAACLKLFIDEFSKHMRKSSRSPVFVASVLSEHCCTPQDRVDKISYLAYFFLKIGQRILISAKREQKQGTNIITPSYIYLACCCS